MGLDNNVNAHQYDDEIDLQELFGVLWAGKIFIVVITALFAIGSVVYALSIPNQYKATALLAPAQSGGGGLSAALGQLGGLHRWLAFQLMRGKAVNPRLRKKS